MDMFDLPQAKRVRRNELNSDSSSQASSEDGDNATSFLRALDPHFVVDAHKIEGAESQPQDTNEKEEETHAFRLFANAASVTLPTSSELQQNDTALAKKLRRIHRPENYWYAQLSESKKLDIQNVALSGDEVKRLATVRWPGCEVKWRVSLWPASAEKGVSTSSLPRQEGEKKRRCRKSKRTRIKLRKRREEIAAQSKRKQEEAQRAVEQAKEKEEYLRQKKTAMNRKKQLKKREKERERKRVEDGDNEESAEL